MGPAIYSGWAISDDLRQPSGAPAGPNLSTFFLPMAAVDPAVSDAPAVALPGLARALVSAGKLGQKAAEDVHKKSQANRTRFIAELTGSGAVSARRCWTWTQST